MNRRLFLAALVSLVSAKLFPQRAAAKQFDFSNGKTRVDGKFISCSITGDGSTRFIDNYGSPNRGQIRTEIDPRDLYRWDVRNFGKPMEFTVSGDTKPDAFVFNPRIVGSLDLA